MRQQNTDAGRRSGGFRAYWSVFQLIAAGSIGKIALLMAGVALAYVGITFLRMGETAQDAGIFIWSEFAVHILFVMAMTVGGALITFQGKNEGSAYSNTLRRLNISLRGLFCCQALYNCLVFLMLWMWQALLVGLMCIFLASQQPEGMLTSQFAFLEIYNHDIFFNLLPVTHGGRMAFNLALFGILAVLLAFNTRDVLEEDGQKTEWSSYVTLLMVPLMIPFNEGRDSLGLLWWYIIIMAGVLVFLTGLLFAEKRRENRKRGV